ncbi:MAG: SDR family oxidoreductase [Alphaproteobacteria bacterium]|nr:SDR family oxidoreductase [Alphaproteobacteria bacterium]
MSKIAWVTGAGSGIGEACAIGLAQDGYEVVLTGRRREPLEVVAKRIKEAGGRAHVKPADLTRAAAVQKVVDFIAAKLGRLDLLVNNAGLNILDRTWDKLTPEGIDDVIGANLNAAFYCARAVLPMMRAQKGGLLLHTASMAGRVVSTLSGATYTAAKHGVVAMSHSINMEECGHGIRSTVMCPGEVNTPILDKRPNKLSAAQRAEMAQPEDCAALVRFIAGMPAHVCINEVLITPTRNRGYLAQQARKL